MVRNFKIKRTPPRVWIGVIIVIFAFILVAWSTDSYYGLIPIIFPILLLIDELLAKVQVQENGDIWLKRGFSGSVKAYGVIRVARRKKAFLEVVSWFIIPKDLSALIWPMKKAFALCQGIESACYLCRRKLETIFLRNIP